MKTYPTVQRFVTLLLCSFAMLLLLAAPARAQIAIQDIPSAIEYSTGATGATKFNPATYTVTAGASVLVLSYASRDQGDSPGTEQSPAVPPTVNWTIGANNYVMTKAVNETDGASTWGEAAIYYLYNPPAGTGTFTTNTGGGIPTDVTQLFWQAYTLSGVVTTGSPVPLHGGNNAGSGGAATVSDTVTGVTSGSWAATGGGAGAAGVTLTLSATPAGGTVTQSVLSSSGNLTVNFGYVANLPAGSIAFTQTCSAANKMQFCQAIFAPLPPPPVAPVITTQPLSSILYAGVTAAFSVTATTSTGYPITSYQWASNNVALVDGGGVTGSLTTNLTISSVISADTASYTVTVVNGIGPTVSAAATLTVVTPQFPYDTAVKALNPVAYYPLNEIAPNPAPGPAEAYDYAGGFNGVYGTAIQNGFDGNAGPPPSGFPGFDGSGGTTFSAYFTGNHAGNTISTPNWNLNGNNVTMIAWINPAGVESDAAGLVVCRGPTTVAGLTYCQAPNAATLNVDLGYIWNNDTSTYNWDSGLAVPSTGSVWSMVALVVTPTQATIYVMNDPTQGGSGLVSSTHVYNHFYQSFGAGNTTEIGDDSLDGGNGTRSFLGDLGEVAVFNQALTGDQVAGLFYAATGISSYTPAIGVQPPATISAYVNQTFPLSVGAYGTDPVTYQWASTVNGSPPYTPLVNGTGVGTYSGVTTATLVNNGATLAENGLNYVCVVTNTVTQFGVVSSPTELLVQAAGAPMFNITSSIAEAQGTDWNTTVPQTWSDNQAASNSALNEPGSFYEVLPGARLRSPTTVNEAVFPGVQLILDGNGIFVNSPAGPPQSEFRTKSVAPLTGNATITFPLLVMNGGQLDNGNPAVADIQGVMDIVSNAPVYVDSGGGAGRPIQIDSLIVNTNTNALPGTVATIATTANIEYHDFDASLNGGLFVTHANNPYTGTWNDVQGLLLGTSSGCLGTNNITVGTNGCLQTDYDVNNPHGSLFLSGKMFLHQNDTFYSVFLTNTPLPTGTYTAAQLTALYPSNFPANWVTNANYLTASGATNASGSITVLVTPGASIITQPHNVTIYPTQTASFTVLAGGNPPFTYTWYSNLTALADVSGVVSGSQTATLTLTNTVVAEAASYEVVVANTLGGATSTVATLSFNATFPAIIPITLTNDEVSGQDWNTPGEWIDGEGGLPASTSAVEYPGSTYEVPPNELLRSPNSTAITYTNFPGIQLQIDGNAGVDWVEGPGNAAPELGDGELRFKQANGVGGFAVSGIFVTNYFPLLILNGGDLDNGAASDGPVEIAGVLQVNPGTTNVIFVDTGGVAGGTYIIDAKLTGGGRIIYHDYDASFSGGLVLSNNNNTFSGTWDVDEGPLCGYGANSLGTNSIYINNNAALETLYNVNNPNAGLTLATGSIMYLHNTDTFQTLNVNGVGMPAGTWTFTQLFNLFPQNFPQNWAPIHNSTFGTASGSITVLVGTAPPLNFAFSAGSLTLTWTTGTLLSSPTVTGPYTPVGGATSPYMITIDPGTPTMFYNVQTAPNP